MKRLNGILIALITFFSLGHAYAYDPTPDIQNAFCNDLGPFSNAATKHARELISIIESMKNDPSCQGMFEQTRYYLNGLMEFERDYYSQQNDNHAQAQVEYIENEIQAERARILRSELADFLRDNPYATIEDIAAEAAARGITPYSDTLYDLENALADTKLELFKYQVEHDEQVSLRSQTSRFGKISNLQRGIDSLFTLLNTSNSCSHDNPGLFTKMGAQVLGASGSIYGGLVGSALIAGGTFLNGLSKFISDLKYKSKLDDVEIPSLVVSAGCGMEGMAKLYCQARDTRNVVKFTIENQEVDCPECKTFFKGLDLVGRQVHVFNRWITKVITGSSPSSGSQAEERIAAFNLRFKLTSSKENIYGKIGETKTLIDQISGDDADRRKNEFRLGLMDSLSFYISMAGGCEGGPSSGMCSVASPMNPFKNSFGMDSQCGPLVYIYSRGQSRVSQRQNGEDCKTFVRRTFPGSGMMLEDQKVLMEQLFLEAEEFVSLRIQNVFEENPMKILAQFEANDPTYNNSPKEFLRNLQEYYDYLLKEYSEAEHPFFIGLIKTMKKRVDQALVVVRARLCPDDTVVDDVVMERFRPGKDCYSPASQVTDIGNILAPRQETRSVESALKDIVTRDLDIKIESGLAPKYIKYLRQVSKERSVNFFVKNYLQVNDVLKDTSRAQLITRKNISVMGDLFHKKYYEFLKELKEVLQEDPEDEEARETFAELCFQTLHSPNDSQLLEGRGMSNSKGIPRLCSGVKYISYVPSKVPHLDFNKLLRLKQRKRLCEIYDFKNMLEIYQVTRKVSDENAQLESGSDLQSRLPKKPYAVIIE